MVDRYQTVASTASPSVLATNKVIRNTYMLLSLTVIFSAITAAISTVVQLNIPPLMVILGYFGLLYATHATARSSLGIVMVFAFTGFMGLTLGPILNMYIHGYSNGPQIVAAALGSTGVIFFALSGYALVTRKNFNYLAGFIFVGLIVALIASLASMFFAMPALELAISAVFVMLMAGYVLFETSQMMHGGQTNYILATINLYVALFNMFINLLQILSAFGGRK